MPMRESRSFGNQPRQGRCLRRTVAGSAVIRNFTRAGQLVSWVAREHHLTERHMNGIIYLVGLIVVVLFILSFFGLR